jgi:hypothetical protein
MAIVPNETECPFQEIASPALQAGAWHERLTAVGMFDDGVVDAADLDCVLACSDMKACHHAEPSFKPHATNHSRCH